MFESIFVPLDGSAFGEQALPVAQAIARRAGAALTLAHVHVPLVSATLGAWTVIGVPGIDERQDAEQRHGELSYLEHLRDRAAQRGSHVACRLLDGPIAPALVYEAAERSADLIVLTTHGRGAFSRAWIGSVADAVIRHSGVPTLLIRPAHVVPSSPTRALPAFEPRRILVALDGSALAEQSIAPALELAELYNAPVTLLRVVEPLALSGGAPDFDVSELGTSYRRSEDASAWSYLKGIAAELLMQGHPVELCVEHGQPAATILQAAHTLGAGLVVLATHGRSGLSRLLMGSVADRVVRGAEQPVLVVRPQQVAVGVDAAHTKAAST